MSKVTVEESEMALQIANIANSRQKVTKIARNHHHRPKGVKTLETSQAGAICDLPDFLIGSVVPKVVLSAQKSPKIYKPH